MNSFDTKKGVLITEAMIKTIKENRNYLSEIDGAIGDGDHGINMSKGFSICSARMEELDLDTSSSFDLLGNILLTEIGGSMGPLYGMFFKSMAEKSKDKKEIDAFVFLEMLKSGLEKISQLGGAKVGDKTLIDVLSPATKAFEKKYNESCNFIDCLNYMSSESQLGLKSTKNMVAKIGRAARLGERSIGVQDAGATSCYLLLEAMKESIQNILTQ